MSNEDVVGAILMGGIMLFLFMMLIYVVNVVILESSINWFERGKYRLVEYATENSFTPPGNRYTYKIQGKNILGVWMNLFFCDDTYTKECAVTRIEQLKFNFGNKYVETNEFNETLSHIPKKIKVLSKEEKSCTNYNTNDDGCVTNIELKPYTHYKVCTKRLWWWKTRMTSYSKDQVELYIRTFADKKVKRIVNIG